MAENFDVETVILMEQSKKASQYVLSLSKHCLENQINYDIKFDLPIKNKLKKLISNFLEFEHEINLYQQASSEMDLKIENYMKNFKHDGDKEIEQIISEFESDNDFETILEDVIKKNPLIINNNKMYNTFINLIKEEDNEPVQGDNEIEMVEKDFVIPIDPISRIEINIPVRNNKCNHLYDQKNFLDLIKSQRCIKCPVSGCTNKKVKIDDVEEDSKLKILIEKARRQK